MPSVEPSLVAGKKRKSTEKHDARKRTTGPTDGSDQELDSEILRLELELSQSRKYYNNFIILFEYAFPKKPAPVSSLAVIVLCRAFSRLLADGSLKQKDRMTKAESAVQKWLNDIYRQYTTALLEILTHGPSAYELDPLQLLMRLVKQEVSSQGSKQWAEGLFGQTLREMLAEGEICAHIRAQFIKQYFKYDDVRFHTLAVLPIVVKDVTENPQTRVLAIDSVLSLLFAFVEPPASDDELETFLVSTDYIKEPARSRKSHLKKGQEAWLSVIRQKLSKQQRKSILGLFVPQIVPWFSRPEQFMDLLTDSYNEGGETTLLALAGIFHLMSEKNLDYPSFFEKLYSLLDDGLLHSKHRSRFFRLLDTFMGSTHLPAALVASFIKRLSRLALSAPPSGIVVVVPWIYNMFKKHPSTTFMMHREARCPEEQDEWDMYGAEDPFSMQEKDPMNTGAIESSVWELETLQSHYHPNVATLAKIISEQFTKQAYKLEDFLDHSYNSLLDIELERDMKKSAVVEYVIPKTIFQAEGQERNLGSILEMVMAS